MVDRKKQKRTLVDGLNELSGLAWTEEGNEVWFGGSVDGSGWGIYGVRLAGDVRLILRFPGPVKLEDLTPDRRVLINRFTAQSGIRYLAPGAQQEKDLSWLDSSVVADLSRDGQWLLFSEFGEGAGTEGSVYLRKTDGSPAVRLGTGGGLALSPDGKWALTMARSRQELSLLPVGVGEAQTIKLPRRLRPISERPVAARRTTADHGDWSTVTTRGSTSSRLAERRAPYPERACSPTPRSLPTEGGFLLASISKPCCSIWPAESPQPVSSIDPAEGPVTWSSGWPVRARVARTRHDDGCLQGQPEDWDALLVENARASRPGRSGAALRHPGQRRRKVLRVLRTRGNSGNCMW